jgi:hypothetical protein
MLYFKKEKKKKKESKDKRKSFPRHITNVPPYDHHQNAVWILKTNNPSSKIYGLIISLQCPKDLLKSPPPLVPIIQLAISN